MLSLTNFVIRALDFASRRLSPRQAAHLLTGRHGEMEAYFHLRSLGYRIIAANVRLPFDRGEIDLIGWDGGTLCFIEVKTRSHADFAPPSAAVDLAKKRHIRSVARGYLRRIGGQAKPHCRFDVVSIVLPADGGEPDITVHKGAFTWEATRPGSYWHRDFRDRHSWRRR